MTNICVKTLTNSSDSLDGEVVQLKDGTLFQKPNLVLIKSIITWQRNKARAGTHKVKSLSEVSGTGKKPYAQKGSGRARKGTLRAPHMRGGCVVHGPTPRAYVTKSPPKKARKLALMHAISIKAQTGKMIAFKSFELDKISTKQCYGSLKNMGIKSALICTDKNYTNFKLSVRNIPYIKVIYEQGLNVYDIMKYDYFIASTEFIKNL
jgi:large subunit ribosomal protein L4